MPIYEYFCPCCNTKIELIRSLSQAQESALCPHCHNKIERVLSSFASFSKSADGASTSIAGGSSCATCSAASCSTCGA